MIHVLYSCHAPGELYEADARDHRGVQHTWSGGPEDDWQGALPFNVNIQPTPGRGRHIAVIIADHAILMNLKGPSPYLGGLTW